MSALRAAARGQARALAAPLRGAARAPGAGGTPQAGARETGSLPVRPEGRQRAAARIEIQIPDSTEKERSP